MEAKLPNSAFKNLLNRDWKCGDEAAGYEVRVERVIHFLYLCQFLGEKLISIFSSIYISLFLMILNFLFLTSRWPFKFCLISYFCFFPFFYWSNNFLVHF